jgi:hypothetical protein
MDVYLNAFQYNFKSSDSSTVFGEASGDSHTSHCPTLHL